jgi:predicted RNase H-related nuclease YkuK (DUF458 family)
MDKRFKKFGGEQVPNLAEYLRLYLKDNIRNGYPINVYIGCDSETFRRQVQYATVAAVYDTFRKDGVHYVFAKERTEKAYTKIQSTGNKEADKEQLKSLRRDVIYKRIWGEVERVLEVAEYLEAELGGYLKRYTAEELVKMPRYDGKPGNLGAHQNKLVDVDIDVNPIAGDEGQNKSNMVYESAVGLLTGMGYRVRCKPYAWAASCSADLNCKRT